MCDTVQPRSLFVIGVDDILGGLGRIGCLEHGISSPRVIVPASMRFHIHWTELPDLPAIMNPCLEATILLFLADFQPVLDQDNAILNDEMLSNGGILEEFLVLLVGAEAHHMLDARPIIPTAVENDDFACCGKMSHVALDVHLRFLAVCRCGQSHYAEDTETDPVNDALDGTSFACCITSLKDDDHPQSFLHHPA